MIASVCAVAVLIGLSLAGNPPAAEGVPLAATPVTVDVDLPSTSTHMPPTGALALRIFAPATSADARYPQGAPVIINVQGGTDAG